MTAGYQLGDPVTFTATLARRTEHRPGKEPRDRARWKVWTPVTHPPRHGIIVGRRTLANGETSYEYEAGELWNAWTAERFGAYLIAFDLHRRPGLVLPEHVTPDDRCHQ